MNLGGNIISLSSVAAGAKSVKEIGDTLNWINEKLKVTNILGKKFCINCIENQGLYEISVRIDQGIKRKLGRKLKFNSRLVNNVSILGFPILTDGSDASSLTPEGYEIDVNKLPDSCDAFIISVNFKILDSIIDRLVVRQSKREPLKEEETYWIHTALKSPKLLTDIYNRGIKIEGVDVTVDVGIINDIKLSIPPEIIKSLEITDKWIKEHERQKKIKLSMEHLRVHRGAKNIEYDKIERLSSYCSPIKFKDSYLDITGPFIIDGCYSKKDYFEDFYFPTFPRVMGVINRTDLSIENPAREGKLIYKKTKFKRGIKDLFA